MTYGNQRINQLIIALIAMAIYIGVISQYFLGDYISQLGFLLFSINWSYLLICYLTVSLATYSVLAKIGVSLSIGISRILLSMISLILALITYLIGYLNEYYILQYHGLSLVLMIFAVIVLLFNLKGVFELIIVLAITLPSIPIPLFTLRIFTDLPLFPTGIALKQLLVMNPGLAIAGSIASTIPLILAALYNNGLTNKSIRRSALSLLIAISIGFIGDVIRISLVSRNIGSGLLSKLISSTAIYALISAILVFLINRKNLHLCPNIEEKHVEREQTMSTDILHVVVVLALLIITTSISQVLLPTTLNNRGVEIRVNSYEEYMNKPASVILSKLGLNVVSEHVYIYDDGVENILISEYTLIDGATKYSGVLDLTKTPCKLYDMKTLLEHRRYVVKQKWVNQDENGTTIYYIARGLDNEILVSQKLLELIIKRDDSSDKYYARITLITTTESETIDLINILNDVVASISSRKQIQLVSNTVKKLAILLYVFIFLLLIYLSIEHLHRVFKNMWKHLGGSK